MEESRNITSLERINALQNSNFNNSDTNAFDDLKTVFENSSSNTFDNFINNTEPTLFAEEGSFWDFSRETCIYVYTGITLATVFITLARSYLFFSICMKASMKLHNMMFSGITRATMYFFHTNPSGRILNRFSKDMGSIDELLPAAMIDCLQV